MTLTRQAGDHGPMTEQLDDELRRDIAGVAAIALTYCEMGGASDEDVIATIRTYLDRLNRVAQALAIADTAYSEALTEHADLLGLLDAYAAKARAIGIGDRDDLMTSERRAREVLGRRPAPMSVCRALVTAYQTWLTQFDPAAKDLS